MILTIVFAVLALIAWGSVVVLSFRLSAMKLRVAMGLCWWEECVLPAGHQTLHKLADT